MDKINILIHQNSFAILAISETWLSDKIPNKLLNIPGFNVYRKDRPSHCGDVLIYIKEALPYTYCPDLNNPINTEVVWVRINNKAPPSLYVSCVLFNPKALLQTIDGWTYSCYTIISVSHWSYLDYDASKPLGLQDTEIYY